MRLLFGLLLSLTTLAPASAQQPCPCTQGQNPAACRIGPRADNLPPVLVPVQLDGRTVYVPSYTLQPAYPGGPPPKVIYVSAPSQTPGAPGVCETSSYNFSATVTGTVTVTPSMASTTTAARTMPSSDPQLVRQQPTYYVPPTAIRSAYPTGYELPTPRATQSRYYAYPFASDSRGCPNGGCPSAGGCPNGQCPVPSR